MQEFPGPECIHAYIHTGIYIYMSMMVYPNYDAFFWGVPTIMIIMFWVHVAPPPCFGFGKLPYTHIHVSYRHLDPSGSLGLHPGPFSK